MCMEDEFEKQVSHLEMCVCVCAYKVNVYASQRRLEQLGFMETMSQPSAEHNGGAT